MFSLVRSGPKVLIFESNRMNELKDYLIREMKASEYDFDTAFEKAEEEYTIMFITDNIEHVVGRRMEGNAVILMEEPDSVLCRLINDKMYHLVDKARAITRVIILRAMGDLERVVQEICKDYKCVVNTPIELLNSYNEKGTVVAITDKPIHRNMSVSDFYEKALFIEEKYQPLLRSLRSHALKYLNSGLGNKDWYEVEIRIYDRYSEYKLHYERLLNIVEWLEFGIILGESWGKDIPRPMMTVEIYRVRFFTFHHPMYVKKLLLGLEILEDGTRIVDYDLYYNRKKLSWSDVADEEGIRQRDMIARKYRKEIISKLSRQEIEKLRELEEKILATRYD